MDFDSFLDQHMMEQCCTRIDNEPKDVDENGFCSNCQVPVELDENVFICPMCKVISRMDSADVDSDAAASNYQSRTNTFRAYVSYGEYRLDIAKEEIPDKLELPENIQDEAIDVFIQAQNRLKVRKKTKASIMAACILNVCRKHKYCIDNTVISKVFDLSIKEINAAEKMLHNLYTEGGISLEIRNINIETVIANNLEMLGIDDPEGKYTKLINLTVQLSNKMQVSKNSTIESKCVGAIWFLIVALKLNIPHSRVEEVCGKREKTYSAFSHEIQRHPKIFQALYAKFEVPYASVKFQSGSSRKRVSR